MSYLSFDVHANAVLLDGLIGVIIASPATWAVLTGLAATLLLVVPTVRERRDRRRAVSRARTWLRTKPDPATLAFAIGGPDRVTDLVIADLLRHERAALIDGELYRLPERPPASGLHGYARPLTDAALATAARAPAPIAELRRVVFGQPLTAALWDETARAGLLRHPYASVTALKEHSRMPPAPAGCPILDSFQDASVVLGQSR